MAGRMSRGPWVPWTQHLLHDIDVDSDFIVVSPCDTLVACTRLAPRLAVPHKAFRFILATLLQLSEEAAVLLRGEADGVPHGEDDDAGSTHDGMTVLTTSAALHKSVIHRATAALQGGVQLLASSARNQRLALLTTTTATRNPSTTATRNPSTTTRNPSTATRNPSTTIEPPCEVGYEHIKAACGRADRARCSQYLLQFVREALIAAHNLGPQYEWAFVTRLLWQPSDKGFRDTFPLPPRRDGKYTNVAIPRHGDGPHIFSERINSLLYAMPVLLRRGAGADMSVAASVMALLDGIVRVCGPGAVRAVVAAQPSNYTTLSSKLMFIRLIGNTRLRAAVAWNMLLHTDAGRLFVEELGDCPHAMWNDLAHIAACAPVCNAGAGAGAGAGATTTTTTTTTTTRGTPCTSVASLQFLIRAFATKVDISHDLPFWSFLAEAISSIAHAVASLPLHCRHLCTFADRVGVLMAQITDTNVSHELLEVRSGCSSHVLEMIAALATAPAPAPTTAASLPAAPPAATSATTATTTESSSTAAAASPRAAASQSPTPDVIRLLSQSSSLSHASVLSVESSSQQSVIDLVDSDDSDDGGLDSDGDLDVAMGFSGPW